MKKKQLSEIKGEGTLSAFAAIIDPLFNLTEDPDVQEMYQQHDRPEGVSRRSYTTRQTYKILSNHEDDFCAIQAVCYGVTPEEYRAQLTFDQALADFADLITDSVWRSFFALAARGSTGTSSGAAQENTAEPPNSALASDMLPPELEQHTMKRFTAVT